MPKNRFHLEFFLELVFLNRFDCNYVSNSVSKLHTHTHTPFQFWKNLSPHEALGKCRSTTQSL